MERQGHDGELLRYERMMEDALRGVVREAVSRVAQFGLPAGHSLYITFKTNHPGVDIADVLRAQYADIMTIVIEHQYWDLAVDGDVFAVTLSFKGRRQRLTVPFAAIAAFHDPGVPFGLRFDQAGEGEAAVPPNAIAPTALSQAKPPSAPPPPARSQAIAAEENAKGEAPQRSGEVVSLEAFRKK